MATNEVDIKVSVIDDATAKLKKIEEAFTDAFGPKTIADAQKASVAFTKAFAVAVTGASVAAGAFAVKSISSFSNIGDAVEKMSLRTGIGARSISALRVAAEASGTSIEGVEGGIKFLQRSVVAATANTDTFAASFGKLGFTMEQLNALKPEEQLAKVGYAISQITDPAERTSMAMDIFGRAGADLIPLFRDMGEGIDGWDQKARALGVSFDDLSAQKAAKLNDAIGEMKFRVTGVALELGSALAPHVIAMIDAFQKWADKVGGLNGIVTKFQETLEKIAPYLPYIAGAITGAMIPAFIAFATTLFTTTIPAIIAMSVALAPWIIGGAIVAGIVMGILWLQKNWETVWGGIKKFFSETWAAITTTLDTALLAMSNAITKRWDDIKASVRGAVDYIIAQVERVKNALNSVGGNISTSFKNLPANLGFRAEGGPVSAGQTYTVGERGPELMVPSTSGRIVPNNAMGGGGINIYITGNTVMSKEDIVEKIGDPLIQVLKQHFAL